MTNEKKRKYLKDILSKFRGQSKFSGKPYKIQDILKSFAPASFMNIIEAINEAKKNKDVKFDLRYILPYGDIKRYHLD